MYGRELTPLFPERKRLQFAAMLILFPVFVTAALLTIAKTEDVPYICKLPADAGPGNKTEVKYFYNATSKQCQKFTYGGCLGNDNRFATEDECHTTCLPAKEVCSLPRKNGLCLAYIESYFYNSTSGQCEFFVYGGCGGNANRFSTEAACKKKCQDYGLPERCILPAEAGNCLGYFPKFFFNSQTRKCEQFIYGGCGGNKNRFDTTKACQRTCKVKREPRSEYLCLLQPKTGPCRAYFPKYFFNVTTTKCERFIYGGCQGNNNRFETKEECQINCNRDIKPAPPGKVCQLQPQTGPCDALIPLFFHNSTTLQCEPFTYGGCGGNDNRFETKQLCKDKCRQTLKE